MERKGKRDDWRNRSKVSTFFFIRLLEAYNEQDPDICFLVAEK